MPAKGHFHPCLKDAESECFDLGFLCCEQQSHVDALPLSVARWGLEGRKHGWGKKEAWSLIGTHTLVSEKLEA